MESEFHLPPDHFVTWITLDLDKSASGSGLVYSSPGLLPGSAGFPWPAGCALPVPRVSDSAQELSPLPPSAMKCLESRPSPNSSFLTGPIHSLLVDTASRVSYQRSHCAALLGSEAFFSVGSASSILCPTVAGLADTAPHTRLGEWPSDRCVVGPCSAVCLGGSRQFN